MEKNNYFVLDDNRQRYLLEQAVGKVGLPAQAVEKDLWVTTILQLVFSLHFADKLIFKGGTSLSKVWGVINRFSEDIDLSVDRSLFGLEGDLTKKKLKKLRKASSVFVREDFKKALQQALEYYKLSDLCTIEAEPDGIGDNTYPEPRKLFIHYKSVLTNEIEYIKPLVMLEIGSRSLFEPNEKSNIHSFIEDAFPLVETTLSNTDIITASPGKTFLEKVFLLHELFSIPGQGVNANRKSRHLYDLYRMMNKDFALAAVNDDELWETIRHHREIYTSVKDMDYRPDIRQRLVLVPREDILDNWRRDYGVMCQSMIYGEKPSFNELLDSMRELERRFRCKS
ncbi:MAG: nucleotidyl transferase AbiEii/AbiGii toxin family protein [Muribaculaceae bacterium]|nr:nucleotidyl transferase AbiEii/AbiGii toxin family protein [Muribaculaceae bacterium]